MGSTQFACEAPSDDMCLYVNKPREEMMCNEYKANTLSLVDLLKVIFDISMSDDEMRKVFAQVDTNNDGYWEKNEMLAALINTGKATLEFLNAVNAISDEIMVSFDEIKGLVKGTEKQVSYAPRSRTPTLEAMPAKSLLGKCIIDLFGCEKLTEKFLREQFDVLDLHKQGLLSQADLCTRFWVNASESVSRSDCAAAINALLVAVDRFEDFKAAVSQQLKFEVAEALEQAPMVHCSGDVIVLKSHGMPHAFEKLLYPLEKAAGIRGSIKYAIYEDRSAKSSLWRVHAVVEEGSNMKARLQFPFSWRNRKGTDLFRNCGVPEIISVSRNGCIGTSNSREGAIAMATLSVESSLRMSMHAVESECLETTI